MRIIFTVTNQLDYDQRMIRICNSLAQHGFAVKIIGVQFNSRSRPEPKNYHQKRLTLFFRKGFGFYVEYNVRLFLYLLFQKADIFCCIDLDTMLPVYVTSILKRKIRVYDAHEYFSQQKEIITRQNIYRVWYFIERKFVHRFAYGYTVSDGIAIEFLKNYGVCYPVIKNVPLLKLAETVPKKKKIILYQGSINEGRGFEYLIPAMREIEAILLIFGDGNFLVQAQRLVKENQLQHKIFFEGKFLPNDLDNITNVAYIGINLVEPFGKNQLLSLANKFFDYMHHAVPQVTMNFIEYRKINDEFKVALLIDTLSEQSVSASINCLLNNEKLYFNLQQNCLKAREVFNWQNEEKKLVQFYKQFNKQKK